MTETHTWNPGVWLQSPCLQTSSSPEPLKGKECFFPMWSLKQLLFSGSFRGSRESVGFRDLSISDGKDGSSFLCRTVSFMVRVDLALLISWFQHVRPVFPPAAGFEGVSSD